jgi:hypothetical protein
MRKVLPVRKLFLTSAAALFLATGAAHAAEGITLSDLVTAHVGKGVDFNCDRLPKYYLGGNLSAAKTTKDIDLGFEVGFSNNRERSLPGDELVIRYNMNTGKLWINGNRCKWGE